MFSLSRRRFLGAMLAATPLAAFEALAAPERGRARITDIRTMVLQGPRTYTLVKVVTDAGVYGIGEGYGSPGVGVRAGVVELRPYFLGKDPLEIETLYSGLGHRIDGSAHMLLRAVSAIEIALWDLAGKLLEPARSDAAGRTLSRPGARVPRRRAQQHAGSRQLQRMGGQDEERPRRVERVPSAPAGRKGQRGSKADSARDPSNRLLTTREVRRHPASIRILPRRHRLGPRLDCPL